jgi:thermosome
MEEQRVQQPVYILAKDSQRTRGKEALYLNILAAKAVGELVRTTLGPRGMDKMLYDELGDIKITNDGATILDSAPIAHPAAKVIVEVAKAQDNTAGDGTTTAAVLAGEFLGQALELLEEGIHPSIVVRGYRLATEKAKEILKEMGKEVTFDDVDTLKKVALTSMTGKTAEAREKLAEMVVEAIKTVAEKRGDKIVIDIDQIKIEKKAGGSIEDTQLVKGIVIDKEVVHPGMPKKVEKAKIALLDVGLEVRKTEIDAKIEITSPEQISAFLAQEEQMIKEMVDKIVESGANVVFCQKGIDELAQHYLAKAGILAVRRVKKSDMEKLARATGAKIVTRVEDLTPEDLGYAEVVEERKVAKESMVFVEGCKDPKSVTILIRGGSEHIVEECARAVEDAIGAVASAVESGRILPGGGATEAHLAVKLREYATTVGGKEQLAIEKFATALEIIPKTLAETAGLDPIDVIVELRAKHSKEGEQWGIDVFEGKITDMYKKNVIEPLKVKQQAVVSAAEAAQMILRIDDIIIATSKKDKDKKEPSEEFE